MVRVWLPTLAAMVVMTSVSCGSSGTDSATDAAETSDVVAPSQPTATGPIPEPSATEPTTNVADPEQASPNVLRVGCPDGPFFPASALEAAPALIEDSAAPELADGIASFLESGEGDFWPQNGYRVLHVVENERATIVHPGTQEFPGLRFMTVDWTPDGWAWSGASIPIDCDLVIEPTGDAGGEVDWVLDPESEPPDPDTTRLVLLANERACAGGTPMGDRLNNPEVTVTPDAVLIQLTVEPQPGEQTCPDNPTQRVEVELPEPLGDREIQDARSTDLGALDEVLTDLIPADQ